MSNLYSDMEAAVVAMLRAEADLGEVRAFEADLRECLFAANKLTQGFRPEELPAINVAADRQPVRSAPFTAGEIGYSMTVTVVIVAKAQTKTDARAKAREFAAAVETAFNAARKSSNALGEGALVTGDLTSDIAVIEEKPYHFAIAEVAAQVLQVVQL